MMIWFDMDGTIADLYGVDGWLDYIRNEDAKPYEIAKVLVNMNSFARIVNNLQRKGHQIGIISWTAKNGSAAYNEAVAAAKRKWLARHLASVQFDAIEIRPYGYNKSNIASANDVLFDDEEQNRENWIGSAYDVQNIIEILKSLS
jgi:hypothetical protein